jgi:septal ring factor EnvC (AmiA/AmiB activator)
MSRAHKALAILIVSTLGLWGCAKGPGSNGPERIKVLEAKVSRLEGDLKVAESAKDQLRKKLTATEERLAKLQKERDDLEKNDRSDFRARHPARAIRAVPEEPSRFARPSGGHGAALPASASYHDRNRDAALKNRAK